MKHYLNIQQLISLKDRQIELLSILPHNNDKLEKVKQEREQLIFQLRQALIS